MRTFLAEVITPTAPPAVEVDTQLTEKVSFTNFGSLLGNIVLAAMIISGLMVFFYLIWGGVQYITSGGDKEQAESARNRITYALIGLVIVIGSYAITKLIEAFFGVNILAFKLPSAPGTDIGTI